jgi:hypothetical protein
MPKCTCDFTGPDPELAKAVRKFPEKCSVLVAGRGSLVHTVEWLTREQVEDSCPDHVLLAYVRPDGDGLRAEFVVLEDIVRYHPPHLPGDTIRAVKASIEADPAARRRDEKPRVPVPVTLPDLFDGWGSK